MLQYASLVQEFELGWFPLNRNRIESADTSNVGQGFRDGEAGGLLESEVLRLGFRALGFRALGLWGFRV